MAEENLVCNETSESWISDNYQDDVDTGPFQNRNQDVNFVQNGSIPMMGFVSSIGDDDISIQEMIQKETDFKPGNAYLKSLRSGDFELRIRNEALDWIWKACAHHHFGPLCIYLSMNYFDRFLTFSALPKNKDWAVQLLAVSCLSLAAKMEETCVPQSVDLQVEDPKFVFEAKTIKRMELLVLNALNWRMQVITPFSFLAYFVDKIIKDHSSENYIYKSSQLLLTTTKVVEFLDFRASEIAAAAAAIAISLSGEAEAVKALASLIHGKQERAARCLKMMRTLSDKMISGRVVALGRQERSVKVPESPNGVLEATCLSCKSDDITIGTCTNSLQSSPDNNKNSNSNKRRKQN